MRSMSRSSSSLRDRAPGLLSNCERNGLSPKFFNVGVIIANATKWLATRAHERFIEALSQHAAGCPYFKNCILNDQCAFNMVVAGDFLKLPLVLNMQQGALHTRGWKTAIIRHYNGKHKFLNGDHGAPSAPA